jgi:hypothetical protein
VANLASIPRPPATDENGGLFFCLRLGLFAMLALSHLFRLLFIQAVAYFIPTLLHTTPYHRYHCSTNSISIAPPLCFCDEIYGALHNSIMIYYWFIVARLLGLYRPSSPFWRPRQCKPSIRKLALHKPRKPPDPNNRQLHLIFIIYTLITCIHVHAIHQEDLPIQSLCAFPLLLFCSSSIFYSHQCWKLRAINNLIIPTPSGPLIENEHHQCHESFLHTTSYATKLAMLSAWQTMNSRAPVLMDCATGK